ncbi:MAG: hypothetical protein Q9227_008570 [Pyrenula ochraceoflavens]
MTHNLRQCQALFLPEASDYIASSASETVSLVQPAATSPFVLGLQKSAQEASLPINVGIHEPADGGKKVKNTLIWIDGRGRLAQRYQKMHLFDVDLRDQGGPLLKESDSVEKGMEILEPFETELGRIGMMICFDLRFPEINLSLKRRGTQLFLYPSAFTVPTGKAHWEALLRARAIESQGYVIAAAQCGRHNGKRVSYGHSLVVSPWGEIVAQLGSSDSDGTGEGTGEPQLCTAEIDLELVEKTRKEMPLLRRTDVYPEI